MNPHNLEQWLKSVGSLSGLPWILMRRSPEREARKLCLEWMRPLAVQWLVHAQMEVEKVQFELEGLPSEHPWLESSHADPSALVHAELTRPSATRESLFTLHLPHPVSLPHSHLKMGETQRETMTLQPLPSHRELFALYRGDHLPDATSWLHHLLKRGHDAKWRVFGGPAKSPRELGTEYAGCLLQTAQRMTESNGGVFFFDTTANHGWVRFHLEKYDTGIDPLWTSVAAFFLEKPDVLVRCGNLWLPGKAFANYFDKIYGSI